MQVGQQVATETGHGGRMHVAKNLTGILKHLNLNNVTETAQYEIDLSRFLEKHISTDSCEAAEEFRHLI